MEILLEGKGTLFLPYSDEETNDRKKQCKSSNQPGPLAENH
jgi:hypothetical protein